VGIAKFAENFLAVHMFMPLDGKFKLESKHLRL